MYVEDLLSLITLDSNGYLSTVADLEPSAHNDKASTSSTPLRAGDGCGQTQGHRQGIQEFFVENMYWNNIWARRSTWWPAVDEGLHVQRRVEVHYERSGWTSSGRARMRNLHLRRCSRCARSS